MSGPVMTNGMPCDCCKAARENPDHRWFNNRGCAWCSARLIKRIKVSESRTQILQESVAAGLDEKAIRALVKAGATPIQPKEEGKKK